MKRRSRRLLIAAALLALVAGAFYESVTRVGRGWLSGEPFHEGRPASYWADEIERWETKEADWGTQSYVRRATAPRWIARMLPEPRWPMLLDGDPNGLAVLETLRDHPSANVQDWARIGIERLDNDERGPIKTKHPAVILTAQLYEVDWAFYEGIAKDKWRSQAELEELERIFLNPPQKVEKGEIHVHFLLDDQKLLLTGKEIKIELDKEGVLLSLTKEITCLPSPAQVRKGQSAPQKIDEGMVLRARVQVVPDRRVVRVTFLERISQLEGIERVPVIDAMGMAVRDAKGVDAVAEMAFVKEAIFSTPRNIPDGANLLLPLQYRPADAKERGRWLVARIAVRVYLEAEERQLQGK